MAFTRFSFTKSWTDPSDFPTVESDETQVRADMQALHDEGKEGLNALMEQLEQAEAAASLGAQALDGSGESTVQEELGGLHQQMEELFGSVSGVVTALGSDHTTIPTSKAVSDAIAQSGNLPSGGEVGQVLMKDSADNYDVAWGTITPESIGALRVAVGSYDGTGTYGSSNRITLTFDFTPYLVIVRPNGYSVPVVFIKGAQTRYANPKRNVLGECQIRVTWDESSVSWYADTYQYYANYGDANVVSGTVSDVMQLNGSYLSYNWLAIGQ